MAAELRHRAQGHSEEEIWTPAVKLGAGPGAAYVPHDEHPSGKESHGRFIQAARGLSFAVYFLGCCVV